MIKQIVALLFGLVSVASPDQAQADQPAFAGNERWITYDRLAPDGMPLVVLARIGNSQIRKLLHEGLVSVVICRAEPSNMMDNGMPQGTASLYALEDKIAKDPTLLAARALHVGSLTGQGQRQIFIAHPDPLDPTPLLQGFQADGFSCELSGVDDRQTLIGLLAPTPLEIQLNGDRDVIASLQRNGDSGIIPRKTDFWFYGRRVALDTLITGLAVEGFRSDRRLTEPDGAVLTREMPVDWSEFRDLTPIIVDAAERAGVEYDGWETIIIKNSTTPVEN